MQFGIIGGGSWATALAKILTDNGNTIHWYIRNEESIQSFKKRRHNPHYLSSAYFNPAQLHLDADINAVIEASEVVVVAVPSAYVEEALLQVSLDKWVGKKIVSAVKGITPTKNQLLHEFLKEHFQIPLEQYFTLLGPCHAEEVAAEKLSYLTFSGVDADQTAAIAKYFTTDYINTVVNTDVVGVQYAAVMKNIYALGAGIAHGLEYGDNFLSVYIANCASEMSAFLEKIAPGSCQENNYTASVYLGDLLVTCYSLYSRNRTFGNMLGKGYSVKSAQLELNMLPEGYFASKCINKTNQTVQAALPIAAAIHDILWENLPAEEGFKQIEAFLQ